MTRATARAMPPAMPPATLRLDRQEFSALLRLGWPVVVSQVGFMLMGVVDTVLVGRFAPEALAGVALGNTWSFAWIIFGRGMAAGVDPLITQAIGAGDERAFHRSLATGAVLMALVALPITAMHGLASWGLRLLGQPESAIPVAQAFAWAVAPSVVALLLEALWRHGLQARSSMRTAMVVALVGNVLNVPSAWILMRGFGGWEGFGPVGVGIATSVVRFGMLGAMVVAAWPDVRGAARALPEVSRVGLGRLLLIAGPVGLQTALEVWAFSGGTLLAGWFGEVSVAAHVVALNLTSMAFMVPLGFSAAAATRVGNRKGAGEDWGPTAATAVATGSAVMVLSATVFVTMPDALAGIYLPDAPEARALAATLLPLAALFAVFDGMQVVSFGVLRGAGDTTMPSVANVVGYYMVGLPFGAWLAWGLGLGVIGVWWGYVTALVCVAAALILRLRWVARRGGFTREA